MASRPRPACDYCGAPAVMQARPVQGTRRLWPGAGPWHYACARKDHLMMASAAAMRGAYR